MAREKIVSDCCKKVTRKARYYKGMVVPDPHSTPYDIKIICCQCQQECREVLLKENCNGYCRTCEQNTCLNNDKK